MYARNKSESNDGRGDGAAERGLEGERSPVGDIMVVDKQGGEWWAFNFAGHLQSSVRELRDPWAPMCVHCPNRKFHVARVFWLFTSVASIGEVTGDDDDVLDQFSPCCTRPHSLGFDVIVVERKRVFQRIRLGVDELISDESTFTAPSTNSPSFRHLQCTHVWR